MWGRLDLVSRVAKTGWVKASAGSDDPGVIEGYMKAVALELGRPVMQRSGMSAELVPRGKGAANLNSLSGRYGLGTFPLHCDNSHWSVPCRYVILGCVGAGSRPAATLLLDSCEVKLSATEEALVLSAVFLIGNGRNSFYSSIRSSGRRFLRLDPGCMRAVDGDGERAMRLYSYEMQEECVARISWNVGDVLAIDNWRILHGRGECKSVCGERKLLRVVVNDWR